MIWIYDGDTIEVDTDQGTIDIRLLDINAPEDDECFYKQSLDHLIDTLKGQTVSLDIDTDLDQFGRTLAYVSVGDRDINLEMVKMGLAIATTPESGGRFVVAEEEAYRSEIGLWADIACGSGSIPRVVIVSVDSSAESIVIVNEEPNAVDLSKWTIRDESSRHRYRFPRESVLQPGFQLIIGSDDPGWNPGGTPVWNNDGDMALLLDKAGRVVDRWRY